jgi:hypothetical protein
MRGWLTIPLIFLLFADADMPMIYRLRPSPATTPDFPPGLESSVLPPLLPVLGSAQSQQQSSVRSPGSRLSPQSELALVRYVSGEFAKAVKPLPGGKEGFLLYVGKPLDQQKLDRAVNTHGAAINTGDNVQITMLFFREHDIVVDVNGGGRVKKRFRDRIHIDFGGLPTVQTTQPQTGPPGLKTGMGSTIFLEFDQPIPDLSPEDLKNLLAPLLDFSKQRSASVQWYDTLPPEMKKAIQDRHPVLGMDREMVVAAIGRPAHKIRERDSDGNEIEDWIYGQPPSKTVFVRFQGDRVTSIKQFPQ